MLMRVMLPDNVYVFVGDDVYYNNEPYELLRIEDNSDLLLDTVGLIPVSECLSKGE